MMVAIPELDGATGPMVFGGRAGAGSAARLRRAARSSAPTRATCTPAPSAPTMLAARVARLVALRRTERAERKVAIVLFNFPPNAGNTGTAAYLSVFESLHQHAARR